MFDLCRLFGCCKCPTKFMRFKLGAAREAGPITPTPRVRRRLLPSEYFVATTITVSQQVPVSVSFVDKKGNPAKVDGVPQWATDNSDVLLLEPAADGLSCNVKAVGMIGTGMVQVTADADLGAGFTPIIGTLQVDVTGGTAATVVLTPGSPTEQP